MSMTHIGLTLVTIKPNCKIIIKTKPTTKIVHNRYTDRECTCCYIRFHVVAIAEHDERQIVHVIYVK